MVGFEGVYRIEYLPEGHTPSRYLWGDQNTTRQREDGSWIVRVEPGVIYVPAWREAGQLQRVFFVCPCGRCQRTVELNLNPEFDPCWAFEDRKGVPHLTPSIGRTGVPEGCHYFIHNGRVVWC